MSFRVTRTGAVLLGAALVAGFAALPAAAAGQPQPHEVHHRQGIEIATRHLGLGQVLTNEKGRVLYIFGKDKPGVSHCGAGCVAAWPRVTSPAKPRAEDGVHGAHLGRIAKNQVTYYGHPLYYFSGDTKPRQASGQNVGSFFVIAPSGTVIKPKAKPKAPPAVARAAVGTHTIGATTVIANSAGHTLYELSNETDGATPTFFCGAGCTSFWRPLLTKGTPTATGAARSGELGTVTRPDGTTQATYNHHPLYTYVPDKSAGDDAGEDLYESPSAGYWCEIDPDGSPIV